LKDVTYAALREHDFVKIIDGVVLETKYKEESEARNPRTGEKIIVPPKYVPKAKFGIRIKELINE
jgi:nucleoid DNA-binding protein